MPKLDDVVGPGQRLATVHNPKDFYPNSFQVEYVRGRVIVVGRVKRHRKKNYRVVGYLKKRSWR